MKRRGERERERQKERKKEINKERKKKRKERKKKKELAQLETPIARYKPGQKEKSGNSCCFQHIDHLFLGHHHHITGTPSQNDQGTIKT